LIRTLSSLWLIDIASRKMSDNSLFI
jgi:hypothetical protein